MSTTKETTPFEQCALLQLPDESLSEILMACDPEGALRMEQTCKILHLLSDSKRLWITLLAKLDYDHAPDVGPHVDLDSLQAKDVKRIVIRALRGYKNWCCPDGPRITRIQKVQLESHQLVAVTVLPGCQYLIVQLRNSDCLGVWDINRERLVARHQYNRRLLYIARDCASLKGGKIARAAFLLDSNPFHLEVVDFDLNRGHATLLFSESVQNVSIIDSLKVREEAVVLLSNNSITLLRPETGKIVIVTVENLDVDLDIVHGTLICLVTAIDCTVRLLVAKLSRIFEHAQDTNLKAMPLEDICEICRVLTFLQPTLMSRSTLNICDPVGWGSARPCRILLAHNNYRSPNYQGGIMVRVHRLYLEQSHNGSDLALTYDISSNYVPLEESSDYPLTVMQQSIPGRWMLPGMGGNGKYDIMVCRLWEDGARFSPSDNIPYAYRGEAERFSGTQIFCLEDGNCILHFFD